MCVCVCVCVCAREREGERERESNRERRSPIDCIDCVPSKVDDDQNQNLSFAAAGQNQILKSNKILASIPTSANFFQIQILTSIFFLNFFAFIIFLQTGTPGRF